MPRLYDAHTYQWVDVDDLPKTYAYNPDGTLASEKCTNGMNTWTKSYTYSKVGSNTVLDSETAWVLS